jgi:hypothetical protein
VTGSAVAPEWGEIPRTGILPGKSSLFSWCFPFPVSIRGKMHLWGETPRFFIFFLSSLLFLRIAF